MSGAPSTHQTSVGLAIHGYCERAPSEAKEFIQRGGDVSELRGDFVLIASDPHGATLLSSYTSALPYYYAASTHGDLIHGANVFDVAKRAMVPWRWNLRAIRCLALYGHTLNDDTLCEGVFRLPRAARVFAREGLVFRESLPVRQFAWDCEGSQESAFQELRRGFEAWTSQAARVHLSLSAGYDSRLLLALCLSVGITPLVSVMGSDDSTDVLVAQAICRKVGLPLEVIRLDGRDYLRLGSSIARTTSGVKTAINWHTYLYGQSKDFSDGVHMVGSNGEFARSFFFDRPQFNSVTTRASGRALRAYWFVRCIRRAVKFSRHNPLVGWNLPCAADAARRAHIDPDWGTATLLPALDAFYAEQRVRHFIGGGLACYAAFGSPRSPFLDAPWIRAVAAMSRHHKQRSRFHADSTDRLNRDLAEVPYNRLPGGQVGAGYHPFNDTVLSNEVTELLLESKHLDEWLSRSERDAILHDSRCDQIEERNLWLTLHFAGEALADA